MKYEFQWRIARPTKCGANIVELAHLCVINRDEASRPRATAVCGYGYPGMPPYQPATEIDDVCPNCMKLERSGIELAMTDANGKRIVIRTTARK